MEIKWNKVEGSQNEKPLELDLISSPTSVYLRRNIERVTRTDEISGETYEMWEYEEYMMSRADYAIYLAEQNAASIADLENAACEESATTDERLADIENAVCELSELLM